MSLFIIIGPYPGVNGSPDWTWTKPDGNTDGMSSWDGTSGSHEFTVDYPGINTFTVEYGNETRSAKVAVVKIAIEPRATNVCSGTGTVDFNLTSDSYYATGGVIWSIAPSDSASIDTNGTVTFSDQGGNYTITATSADLPACSDNASLNALQVNINPTWDIVTEGADSGDIEAIVTPTGLSGLTYSWSWEPIVSGGGNNPSVTFSSSDSATTRVNRAHWYAVPDAKCASNRVSEYRLWCTVTVNGVICSNSMTMSVELKDQAAEVVPTYNITGDPSTNYDAVRNIWYVSGTGTLSRELTLSTNWNLHTNSEFAKKMMSHEDQHSQDYISGFDGHEFFTVNELYARLSSLTDSTSTGLIAKIFQEWANYKREEGMNFKNLKPCFEVRAYNASDAVAPNYYYSNCGRYSCP